MHHCWATRDAWQNKGFLWGNVVGTLSLCLIYELSRNILHILPTCCHCAESSAEDKLAFKWGKLFSLCPLWITNAGALICDERRGDWWLFWCYWPRKCWVSTLALPFFYYFLFQWQHCIKLAKFKSLTAECHSVASNQSLQSLVQNRLTDASCLALRITPMISSLISQVYVSQTDFLMPSYPWQDFCLPPQIPHKMMQSWANKQQESARPPHPPQHTHSHTL